VSVCPSAEARCRGVQRKRLRASAWAPFVKRILTVSACPPTEARCSGVSPLCSAFGSMPIAKRASTASVLPTDIAFQNCCSRRARLKASRIFLNIGSSLYHTAVELYYWAERFFSLLP